jgi:hypothetical protein
VEACEADREARLAGSRRGNDDEVPSLCRANCVVLAVGPELAQALIANSPPAGQPLRIHASSSRRGRANNSGTPSVATIAAASCRALTSAFDFERCHALRSERLGDKGARLGFAQSRDLNALVRPPPPQALTRHAR